MKDISFDGIIHISLKLRETVAPKLLFQFVKVVTHRESCSSSKGVLSYNIINPGGFLKLFFSVYVFCCCCFSLPLPHQYLKNLQKCRSIFWFAKFAGTGRDAMMVISDLVSLVM